MLVPTVAPSSLQNEKQFPPVRDLSVEKLTNEGTSHKKRVDTGYHTGQHFLENFSDDCESLESTIEYLGVQKPRPCTGEKGSLLQKSSGFICNNCGRVCADLCTGRELSKTVLQMLKVRQHVDEMFEDDPSVEKYSLNGHDREDLHRVDRSTTSTHHQHCRKKQLEHHHRQLSASYTNEMTVDTTGVDKWTFTQCVQDTQPHMLDQREEDRRWSSLRVQHTFPRPFVCNVSMCYVGEET